MGDALLRCKREIIKIHTVGGHVEIRAWRLGDFACHLGRGEYEGSWVVTHLETGKQLSSAGVFPSEDQAADAMEQIAAEGDWSDLSDAGRSRLGPMVKRVFADNGAERA